MAKTGRTTRRKSSLPKLIEKYYADLAEDKATAFFPSTAGESRLE